MRRFAAVLAFVLWGAIAPSAASATGWSLRPVPNADGTRLNGVSCVTPRFCLAVGGNKGGAVVERWNGSAWQIEPTPPVNATLTGVSCTDARACTAVGGSTAERWDGSSWSVESLPVPSDANSIFTGSVSCPTVHECVVAGGYFGSGGNLLPYTELWDGSTWTLVPSARAADESYDPLFSVSCARANSCEAVGRIAEHWNGVDWTRQSFPIHTGSEGALLFGVSCPRRHDCVAVGTDFVGGDTTLADHWGRSGWRLSSTPSPALASELSGGVSCASQHACTAVGWSNGPGFTDVLAERWNGSSWFVQPAPVPAGANQFLGVSCATPHDCMAVGEDVIPGSAEYAFTESWNG